MKYILDSSVAFKWEITEVDSDKADAIRDDFRKAVHELLSPDFFTVEASHALTRAERQGRIAVGEARKLFLDILTTPPKFVPFQPYLLRAIDIASKMRVGVYDCVYVALAEQENCEYITADDKLVKNLQPAFPFIVGSVDALRKLLMTKRRVVVDTIFQYYETLRQFVRDRAVRRCEYCHLPVTS